MNVQVVVPWSGGCRHRERAVGWLLQRLRCRYSTRIAPGGEPWSKGAAFYPALETSSADIVVMHDADVWCQGLAEAVRAVADGAAWAIPHERVVRLSEAGTTAYMASGEWSGQPLDQPPYSGVIGGGIVVGRREVMLDVPIDPRFVGWQGDDESWSIALWSTHGECWRGSNDLVHLWHPPQPRRTRRQGSDANWELYLRYKAASYDRALMVELLAEVHAALGLERQS